MKGLHKRILLALFTLVFSMSFVRPVFAEESTNTPSLGIEGSAAFLVEFHTGKVLYADNADEALPIASMTKMMSAYLIEEAIAEGRLSWDQKVTISEYAHKISQDMSLSNVPLLQGAQYTVEELYAAMSIYSANGATIAIAEALYGTEQNFVNQMNKRAEELGLENFRFVNSTGLNNESLMGMHPESKSATEENIASARDMAVLAYRLISDFPETLEISSIPIKFFREGQDDEIRMVNWNRMLLGLEHAYEGMDGLKTGSTSAAGSCFTGTAERNGMRLISVVLNTKNRDARFVETRKLLDYGFNNFEIKEALPKGYQEKGHKIVTSPNGRGGEVEVATAEAFSVLVKRGSNEELKPTVHMAKEEIDAPAKKGTTVGTISLENTTGDSLGYLLPEHGQVNLVTTTELDKANWFVLTFRSIGSFFGGLVDKVVGLF